MNKIPCSETHDQIREPWNKGKVIGARPPLLATPWFFPTVEEYGALLTEGGFTVKEIALVPRLTPLETGIEGWLRTFGRCLFDQFAEPERTKVVGKVIELLRPSLCDSRGVWTADHVRVRFIAERGA